MKNFLTTIKKTAIASLVVALILSTTPIDTVRATNVAIRQEINITDAYINAASGSYATSSGMANLDSTKFNGATYYFEVVASTSAATNATVSLVDSTTGTPVTSVTINGTSYTRYRSSSFAAPGTATNYSVRLGNESVSKGIIASRIVILQSASSITNTETQIEIGNKENYTSSATSTLASPKYWFYDSAKWDGTTSFAAEVTYQRVTDATVTTASSTSYTTAATYTVVIPSGVASTSVELWGGGGGGGAASVNTNGSGSGGAGGTYAKKTIAGLGGSSFTLVVGAGGNGGASTAAGSQGATTTWNSTTVVAGGGMGGRADSGAAGTGLTTGSTGDIVNKGGNGAAGTSAGISGGGGEGGCTSGNGNNATTGTGGVGCDGGDGADGRTTNGVGGIGFSPGGGGSGGRSTGNPNQDGGAGGVGQAIITDDIVTSQNATTTIALQEDDGSFGNWGTPGGNQQVTIVAAGTASTPTRVRVNFTPTSGRNYRIVVKNGYNGATFAIYNAKIIVDQTGSSGTTSGDITSSLIAWYKCDEGSGTTVTDSSSGGNTGTMNGDGTWFSPGKVGTYACSFSGTAGGGVSITRFHPGTTFTYAGWIYIPTGTVNAFANVMANGNGTGIWVVSNKIDYDAAGGGHTNNTTITRDTWHHIAVVNNASAVTFYLDGSSDGTATVAQDQFFDGMGCDSGTLSECFTGYQDDVRLYSRALTANDIATLYAYGTSDLTSNLNAYYKFEEGSGSAPLDSSGNNYTAGTTNGPTYVSGKIGSYAMSFTAASTQYASLPSGTSIAADGNDFSIAFWIKFTTTSRGIIWGQGSTSNSTPFILADVNPPGQSTGTVGFRTRDDGGNLSNIAVTTRTDLNDGNWHHIVFTQSGAHPNRTRKIYVDGLPGGTTLSTEAFTSATTDSFEIGALQNGSATQILPLDGTVDDLRLYKRTLSATDVAGIYTFTGTGGSSITKIEPQYLLANTLFASGTGLQKFLTSWASSEWVTDSISYFHEVNSNAGSSVVELDTSGGTQITGSSLTANAVRKRSGSLTMPSDGDLDVKATTNNGDVYASRIIVQAVLPSGAAASSSATPKNGLIRLGGKILRLMGKTLRIK